MAALLQRRGSLVHKFQRAFPSSPANPTLASQNLFLERIPGKGIRPLGPSLSVQSSCPRFDNDALRGLALAQNFASVCLEGDPVAALLSFSVFSIHPRAEAILMGRSEHSPGAARSPAALMVVEPRPPRHPCCEVLLHLGRWVLRVRENRPRNSVLQCCPLYLQGPVCPRDWCTERGEVEGFSSSVPRMCARARPPSRSS
ncbi:hypothetical protein GGP88_001427 [Salinibacter ruber]|nr:hypothetical protein [Salinibacter ruber]